MIFLFGLTRGLKFIYIIFYSYIQINHNDKGLSIIKVFGKIKKNNIFYLKDFPLVVALSVTIVIYISVFDK